MKMMNNEYKERELEEMCATLAGVVAFLAVLLICSIGAIVYLIVK